MPKVKSSSKPKPAAPGLSGITISGPDRPLVPRTRGPQTARDPRNNGRFWLPSSTEVKVNITPVFRRLMKGIPDEYRPDYGMEDMDGKIEEAVGNSLLLAGPLVDYHLTSIGEEISARLRRNNSTGQATFEDKVPPSVFSYLMLLMKRYGARVDVSAGPGMYGTVSVKIASIDILNRVFCGARSDGRSYLVKVHFDRERTPDKRVISHFRGRSLVVATDARRFEMIYRSSKGRLKVSFFRQTYDRNGLAEDTILQAAMQQ